MEQCCKMSLGYIPPHPQHLYHLSYPIDYASPILNLSLAKKPHQIQPAPISPRFVDNQSNLTCASPTITTYLSPNETISKKKSTTAATTVKPSRPFKVFPKNSLQFVIGMSSNENFLGNPSSVEAYIDFRNKIMSQVETSNDINKSMRRNQVQTEKTADPEYLERRKKNNEAARRSREARKVKEDEIAIRCAFLEQENMRLKYRLAALESELNKLQRLMYY